MSNKSSKKNFSQDETALILGIFIVFITIFLFSYSGTNFKAIKYGSWENFGELFKNLSNGETLGGFLFTGIVLTLIFTFGHFLMCRQDAKEFFKGFIILYLICSLVYIISSQKTLKNYLEYAFWALLIGLFINNVLGMPKVLKYALKSDFYIKIGLILMGCEVLFSNIASFGKYGIAISWVVVPIVIIFMWYFGMRYLKMKSPTMVMVIAVATSVCGVSAAVAAAAAIKADKEDLTFAVGISIIFTIIMMILMPVFIKMAGINELVGGAWIGNTIDSTGAVVLAGEALGPVGSQVAAMIKMIQNVLIGFISFIIAIFFAKRENTENDVTVSTIWQRLPKFIFGFVGMSMLFSFVIQPRFGVEATNILIKNLGTWKGWTFCLTFLCIGLETNFKELKDSFEGGKPVTLYLVGQTFSLILSLIICEIVLGGHFFPVPEIVI